MEYFHIQDPHKKHNLFFPLTICALGFLIKSISAKTLANCPKVLSTIGLEVAESVHMGDPILLMI